MDMYVERRKTDLMDKKPSAISKDDTLPRFIWVHMLKKLKVLAGKGMELYALRGKFNSKMEERLFDGNEKSHHIMSIEVEESRFNLMGFLTASGKASFWSEVNRALEKFNKGEILLQPRKNQGAEVQQYAAPPHHALPANSPRKSR